MTAKRHLKKCTNDVIKIILYMVLITTLIMLYCSNTNDENVNSIDYYQLYNNKANILQLKNGKYGNII